MTPDQMKSLRNFLDGLIREQAKKHKNPANAALVHDPHNIPALSLLCNLLSSVTRTWIIGCPDCSGVDKGAAMKEFKRFIPQRSPSFLQDARGLYMYECEKIIVAPYKRLALMLEKFKHNASAMAIIEWRYKNHV